MPPKTDVKPASSNGDSAADPSVQGDESLTAGENDERGVSWENKAKEFQRKHEEASSALQELQESKNELESRLGELEQKANLNSNEQREKDNIEIQISELERSEKARPWMGLLEKRLQDSSARNKNETLFETSIMLMDDFIQQKAEGLKIEPKELEKILDKIGPVGSKLPPHVKVKLAWKEYNDRNDFEKRKADLETREAAEKTFRETGERTSETTSTLRSQISQAKSPGDWEKIVGQV